MEFPKPQATQSSNKISYAFELSLKKIKCKDNVTRDMPRDKHNRNMQSDYI